MWYVFMYDVTSKNTSSMEYTWISSGAMYFMYINLNVEDIDDYEKEYDRMDRELDMAHDHQRQVLCNIMEEVDALDILLNDDRLNRRRMQGAVKIIRQMINREL